MNFEILNAVTRWHWSVGGVVSVVGGWRAADLGDAGAGVRGERNGVVGGARLSVPVGRRQPPGVAARRSVVLCRLRR